MRLNIDSLTAKPEIFGSEQEIRNQAYSPLERQESFHWRAFLSRLVVTGNRVKKHLAGKRSKERSLTITNKSIPLRLVAKGSRIIIVDIPDDQSRTRLIRLGIIKGEPIQCLERLPGGTVVIEKNRQEIAVGASLAKAILVSYAT